MNYIKKGESGPVSGTREGRLDEERRRQGGMEGQSPVVWEWSSALHRGWRFLLLPPPQSLIIPTHHNPLTSSPFAPPPLLYNSGRVGVFPINRKD